MNRKGTVIGILTALGFLAALIVYLNVNPEDVSQYEKYLGDIQFKVLSAYYGSENLMFFYDKVIEYGVYESVYELGQKGGFNKESECGEYNSYSVWYDKSSLKKCYPRNLEKDFFSLFEKNFNEMISNSEYSEIDGYEGYNCEIFDLNGKKYLIKCEIKDEINYPIEVERELFIKEDVLTGMQMRAVEIARSYLGKSITYKLGGTGPNSYDCSGFVQEVYKKLGLIDFPRTVFMQYTYIKSLDINKGNSGLDEGRWLPGDLCFKLRYGDRHSTTGDHIGIYSGRDENGNHQWIDSSSSHGGVNTRTDNIWNYGCLHVSNSIGDSISVSADNLGGLKKIVELSGLDAGISIKNFKTNDVLEINGDKAYPSASTIKVAVAVAYLKKGGSIDNGNLNRMILNSDNNAANVLINEIGGIGVVNKVMSDLGLSSNSKFGREFLKSARVNDNYLTPSDSLKLFEILIDDSNTYLDISKKKALLHLLKSTGDDKPPRFDVAVRGAEIANKWGECPTGNEYPNGACSNDAGIIYLSDGTPMLVSVFVRGGDQSSRISLIKEVASFVYQNSNKEVSGVAFSSSNTISRKETAYLGNYKVKHVYKKDIYSFNDYDKIQKGLDECLSKLSTISDNVVLREQLGGCLSLKTKMDVKVSLENGYLLFDVNTGKKVVVVDGLHDVVINFAVKL